MPYTHVFSAITAHVQTYIVAGGYPLLFLMIFLEGVPVIGMLVPGHVAVIAAGFFVRIGVFNIWWVLAISIAAAVTGDFMGFSIGKKYGMSFIDRLRPYFFITDAHMKKAQNLVTKHTGLAMIGGRFSPVTRPLTPFLVGASTTKIKRFWLFNIIGGASWVVLSVIVGYAFGAGYAAGADYFGQGVLVAIICTILILWSYRFVNKRFHVFKRYELFALMLNVISIWALSRTIQDASAAHSFLANFDVSVNLFSAHVASSYPIVPSIAAWISTIGGVEVFSWLAVISSIAFSSFRKWRSTAIMLLSIGSVGVISGIMKDIFLRARPENALQFLVDPSFPSAHAAFAAAFFVAGAYLVSPLIRSWVKRELLIVGCVIAVILIGLSRIALNVHWASDVIGGWALGVFCATASILFVKYMSVLFFEGKLIEDHI